MLGASYEEGRDIFPLADLERLFSVEHLNKAPAVFDYKKLEWFNGQYIRAMGDEELYEAVRPFLTGDEPKDVMMRAIPLIKERLRFLEEAPALVSFLFREPAVPPAEELIPKKLDAAKTKEILFAALEFVKKSAGMEHDAADALAREYAEKLGVKLGDFMMPVRLAVTGSRISPPLIGSLAILGVEKAAHRIEKAISVFA
jgi:glutamyl-tRNA synthetase